MTGKTRSFERPTLPVFRASCGACGWTGREWSFQAIVREEQAEHTCKEEA